MPTHTPVDRTIASRPADGEASLRPVVPVFAVVVVTVIAFQACLSALDASAAEQPDEQRSEAGRSEFRWERLPDLPDPLGVAGPFVGVHDDALIVAGGANFPQPVWESTKVWHDRIHVLIKREDGTYHWHDGGKLPRPIAYGAAVSTRHGVICMGGNDAEKTFRDVILLRWNHADRLVECSELPPLPTPCAYGQAALVNNTIYLAGGQSDQSLDSAMCNFWSLDLTPLSDQQAAVWKVLTPWPGESRAFNLTVSQSNGREDCVYVISGRRQNGSEVDFLKDVWVFSPLTSQWKRLPDAPRSVMAGTGIGIGKHHIYIPGGADGSLFTKADELRDRHPGFPTEALLFNTIAGVWTTAGSVPRNHVTTIPVMWRGRVIIATGEVRPRVRSAAVWSVSP